MQTEVFMQIGIEHQKKYEASDYRLQNLLVDMYYKLHSKKGPCQSGCSENQQKAPLNPPLSEIVPG